MVEEIISSLKKDGYRMTKARRKMIEIFLNSSSPLSAKDVSKKLGSSNILVDKSTIYREIKFLSEEKIVKQVKISSDRAYFESAFFSHHHHLICKKCNKIDKLASRELEKVVKNLKKKCEEKLEFYIKNHVAEFYGVCGRCT